jgi:hypothetical protein
MTPIYRGSCDGVGEQPLQSRPIRRRAGEPAAVITLRQAHPAFVSLAVDESLAGLALRLQRMNIAAVTPASMVPDPGD